MTEQEFKEIELTQDNIESMIYLVRGQKIMLDFDLARIYGYETKMFNRQVKNNIEKFPEDFMFQLTKEETENLRSKKLTTMFGEESRCKNCTTIVNETSRSKKSTTIMQIAGIRGGRVYLPYAFTEQGIYTLMTVLKGELAIKQSKALIRLFKKMKDYIVENALTYNNVSLINDKFAAYDKRFDKVETDLKKVMDNFIDPSTYKHFLILDGQRLEADIAYQTIYRLAKHSLLIVDDYIDVKTLNLLKVCNSDIEVIASSDNKARNKLDDSLIADFQKETNLKISFKKNNNKFHNRYIVVDYKTDNECIYHCGASSKDVGNRITTINIIDEKEVYRGLIDNILIASNIL